MQLRKNLAVLLITLLSFSCWKPADYTDGPNTPPGSPTKVWGYKPIYGSESSAKGILYTATPKTVANAGNIYAYGNYIFQIDAGFGIHVIDNSVPSAAARAGFITVKGCSQISIKDSRIYTNSYDDLVVLDCSDINSIHEQSRLPGVFVEYKYGSPIAMPPAPGYYQCPRYDSLVVGWAMDSIYKSCYRN